MQTCDIFYLDFLNNIITMKNILKKTEALLRFRSYSPRTRKSYLLYIKEYLAFAREHKIKGKNEAIEQLDADIETDIVASTLYGFVVAIKDVVGEIHNKEIVQNIFSNFCVGK